jgi:hypothetical protein
MNFVEDIDPDAFEELTPLAESDQFCIYALGDDTYMLLQRHEGTPWTGLRLSGDGLFRVSALINEAMRDVYRHVASRLSPARSQR